MKDVRQLRVDSAEEARPPLPPAEITFAGQLQELMHYVGFSQTDGYLRAYYTDSGLVPLACGAEESVPYYTYTPEEQQWVDDDDPRATALRDTGWIAELTVGWPTPECPLDVEGCEHFVGSGATLDAAIQQLYERVRAGRSTAHTCGREEREIAAHAAIRRAIELFQAGNLPVDEFPSLEAAILDATRGHWRFTADAKGRLSTEEAAAILKAAYPEAREIIDLRPEAREE